MAPDVTSCHGDNLMMNGSMSQRGETPENSLLDPINNNHSPKSLVYPEPQYPEWKPEIIWLNTISITILHLVAVYAVLTASFQVLLPTYVWGESIPVPFPAFQNTIFDWVRDHRVHHKFSETNADPHNSNRGFFFAHVGWLMTRKHPEVIRRGQQLDMSDVVNDPVVAFHHKYFTSLKLLFCFFLPIMIPPFLWGESWSNSIMAIGVVRYVLSLNFTWLVNSAAHLWGNKPYDKRINPAENRMVALVAMGEGWHNYHHVFPWDYKAAELGNYSLNVTTFFLDLFAKIGWAYDLKCPSQDLVRRVIERNGDGSHPEWGCHPQEVPEEEDQLMVVKNPSCETTMKRLNGSCNQEDCPPDSVREVPEEVARCSGEVELRDKKHQ
uniref:Fatty acid desaturase domain-containing protein n=1 Tax=Timema genevievae TaxID=629358 RepID=A0A7R9PRE0_TIMGE|nr:unnamed protein product [Timema genevievae]